MNSIRPKLKKSARLSVAPMMDWTDRHCRYFHRLFSKDILLYTEMVTAQALMHGDAERLIGFHSAEHPVALQLGGSDPDLLARATKLACEFGYDEINLNVGCPSDRVQSGRFGACLMAEPALVAECVGVMAEASTGPEITVKCRIGIDEQDPEVCLPKFIEKMVDAGIRRLTIHARKAWLEGLSPKQNREIPPLNYPLVRRMKQSFPQLHISVNGGIVALEQAVAFLNEGMDGVMIGRAAYHDPANILGPVAPVVFGSGEAKAAETVVLEMLPYIEQCLGEGVRLNQITRHMLGSFSGRPGARQWRRILSEQAHKPGAGVEIVERALAAVVSGGS